MQGDIKLVPGRHRQEESAGLDPPHVCRRPANLIYRQRESLPPFHIVSAALRQAGRTITIDGEGGLVREFWIVPSIDGIELDERNFLRKEISLNPVAIAFEPGKLKPKENGCGCLLWKTKLRRRQCRFGSPDVTNFKNIKSNLTANKNNGLIWQLSWAYWVHWRYSLRIFTEKGQEDAWASWATSTRNR